MISKNYVRHIATVLSITSTLAIPPLAAQEQKVEEKQGQVIPAPQDSVYNMDTKNGFLRALDFVKTQVQQKTAEAIDAVKTLTTSAGKVTLLHLTKLRSAFSQDVRAELVKFFNNLKNEKKLAGKNADLIPELCNLPDAEILFRINDIINRLNQLKNS